MSESLQEQIFKDPVRAQRNEYFHEYYLQLYDMSPENILDAMRADHQLLGEHQITLSIPALAYGAMKGIKDIRGVAYNLPHDLEFMSITPDNCFTVLKKLQKNINADQLEELHRIVGRIALQTQRLFVKEYLTLDPNDSFRNLPQDLREPPFKTPAVESSPKPQIRSAFRKLLTRIRPK